MRRPRTILTDQEKAKIVTLYQEYQITSRNLATRFGIPLERVLDVLRSHNVRLGQRE